MGSTKVDLHSPVSNLMVVSNAQHRRIVSTGCVLWTFLSSSCLSSQYSVLICLEQINNMKQSKYCCSATFTVSIRNGCAEKADNGAIPLETTGLVDKSKDKLHVKSEHDAFSMSGAGSSSHNSHSTNSRTSQRTYDKLAFPRQELQTLGMLGLFLLLLFSSPKQIFSLQHIPTNWSSDYEWVRPSFGTLKWDELRPPPVIFSNEVILTRYIT